MTNCQNCPLARECSGPTKDKSGKEICFLEEALKILKKEGLMVSEDNISLISNK